MQEFNIWEGVYSSFEEAPVVGDGYNGNDWVENSLKLLNDLDTSLDFENNVLVKRNRDNYLPFLVASSLNSNQIMNVLDFGGGIGFTYKILKLKTMNNVSNLKYHVIETPRVCEAGREYFANDKNIFFYEDFSSLKSLTIDILHLGSCLQYVKNWKDLLSDLLSLKPNYVLLTGLVSGDIETFVSVQNYYGSKIPVYFFSTAEVIKFLESFNLKLSFKSEYTQSYFGKEGDVPMNNFPEKLRIKKPLNLFFKRIEHQ